MDNLNKLAFPHFVSARLLAGGTAIIAALSGMNLVALLPITDAYGGYDARQTLEIGGDEFSTEFTATPNTTLPVANSDSVYLDMDSSTLISVLANDTGLEDGLSDLSVISPPANGWAEVTAEYSISYVLAKNYSGDDSFVYRIVDTNGNIAVASVTIQVDSENQNCLFLHN